jgi:hypothetical protein
VSAADEVQSVLDRLGLDADTLATLSRPFYGQRDPIPLEGIRPHTQLVGLTVHIDSEPGPMLNMPLLSEQYLAARRLISPRRNRDA